MEPPGITQEAVAAAPPKNRRRGRGARLVEFTFIFTFIYTVLSMCKLEPIARNSVQDHYEKIDQPALLRRPVNEISIIRVIIIRTVSLSEVPIVQHDLRYVQSFYHGETHKHLLKEATQYCDPLKNGTTLSPYEKEGGRSQFFPNYILYVASGGPKGKNNAALLLQTPWITGAGIGATVGYIAPNQVYGPVMEYCWQIEGMAQSMNYVMSVPFATEVSVATGAVAGMILHPLLYYPIHGINGIHWGFPLAAVTSALYFIYYGREESGLPVPEGSYVDRSDLELVESILRYNNMSGEIETYSLKSEQFIGSVEKCFQGREIAELSRSYSSSSWGSNNKVVFDDRLLAFVYNYWDVKTATRYPDHVVSNIPTKSSLQMKQDSMLLTDASVATLLHKNDLEAIQTALDDVDRFKTSSGGVKESSSAADLKALKAQNEVNIALELLMLLRQASKEEKDGVLQNQYTDEIPKLEKYIRRKSPKIVLYINDEECKGESVESQLRNCDWKRPKDLSSALEQWHPIKVGGTKHCLHQVLFYPLDVHCYFLDSKYSSRYSIKEHHHK